MVVGIVNGQITEGFGHCAEQQPGNPWRISQDQFDTSAEPWLED
jgi:hypothetical protein